MRTRPLTALAALAWLSIAAAAPRPQAPPPAGTTLSAEQIVAKNVAARGGLEAWRRVETMGWSGHVKGTNGGGPPMSFVMELRRPNMTHFEISTIDKRFARIFDGTNGWRLRPSGNGLPELKPFSKEEIAFARDEFVIDGPLIDAAAKGVAVKLAGLDELEGRKAYLLEVTLPGGASRRIWVDAKTFLDFRIDRPSTSPLIKGAPISVYYSDFRPVEGLLIPHTIETRAATGTGPSQTLAIDRVVLNPSLPPLAFAKPAVPRQRHAVVRAGQDASPPPSASARAAP